MFLENISNLFKETCDIIISNLGNKPFNINNPWYFDFCGETPSVDYKTKTLSKTTPKAEEKTGIKTPSFLEALKKPAPELSLPSEPKIPTERKSPSLIKEFTKPAAKSSPPPKTQVSTQKTSPPPKPQLSAQKPQSIPATKIEPLKKTISESASISVSSTEKLPTTTEEQVKYLEEQLDSTRDIVLTLDKRFNAGLFNLEEYLEKKNVLIKKIETFKSQIEKLKK